MKGKRQHLPLYFVLGMMTGLVTAAIFHIIYAWLFH